MNEDPAPDKRPEPPDAGAASPTAKRTDEEAFRTQLENGTWVNAETVFEAVIAELQRGHG